MKRFKKILCVLDSERTMQRAIAQSLNIANSHQAEVTFIYVVKEAKFWQQLFNQQDKDTSIKDLMDYTESTIKTEILNLDPSLEPDIVLCSGIAFIEVIKYAIDNSHDLVVKCAEDVDWIDRMLGSEDMHLLRKCPCPVLMLTTEQQDSFKKILATVDVNEDTSDSDDRNVQMQLNEKVLEYSAALSMPELSEMHIGTAWEAYYEDFLRHRAFTDLPDAQVDQYAEQSRKECKSRLESLVQKMTKLLGETAVECLQPSSHLVKGTAARIIPLMVEKYDIDLIVMGTVGRVGIPGLIIGNTAESILEQTNCSILAIKPDGFKTPVE